MLMPSIYLNFCHTSKLLFYQVKQYFITINQIIVQIDGDVKHS